MQDASAFKTNSLEVRGQVEDLRTGVLVSQSQPRVVGLPKEAVAPINSDPSLNREDQETLWGLSEPLCCPQPTPVASNRK